MSNDSTKQGTPLWRPWVGVLYGLAVFFMMQIAAGVVLYAYPALRQWGPEQIEGWLKSSVPAQTAYLALTNLGIIGAVLLFVRRRTGGLAAIGIRKPRLSDGLYGLAAVLPYFILYAATLAVVVQFWPSLDVNQKQELGFDTVHNTLELALIFGCLVLLAPLMEEILVRGLLYRSLRWSLPLIPAAVAASLLFAAAHLPEGGAAGPLYIAAIDTFVLSLVLIYLREKTGGLWASMVLHAIKNLIAFVAVFGLHLR